MDAVTKETTVEERARAAIGMALFSEPSSALPENDEENFTQTQGELIKHVANAIRAALLDQIRSVESRNE